MAPLELRHLSATLIFDLEDGYALRRGLGGLHPRPLGRLVYRLLGRVGPSGVEPFGEPLELSMRRNPSGYDLFFGVARTPNGVARRVSDGVYRLRVSSRDGVYQPVVRDDIALPQPTTPYAFELEPGAAYPLPSETLPGGRGVTVLRGTLLRRDGTGIAGVTVRIPGLPGSALTDGGGQWMLVLGDEQPTGNVSVRFEPPPGLDDLPGPLVVPDVLVVGGRETSLRETALRGAVSTADGRPLAGATVTVSGGAGPVESGRDGSWAYHFRLDQGPTQVTVTATLPDGRTQALPGVEVVPRTTTSVPSFRF